MFSKGPVALCNERKPLGVACAACFEELAGVFASSVAMRYAKILTSLKKKNDMRQPTALGVLCSLIQGLLSQLCALSILVSVVFSDLEPD